MKKFAIVGIFVLLVALMLPSAGLAQADSGAGEDKVMPGITPDSGLYFMDKAFDGISLAFTANPERKADKALQIAGERLAEVKAMIEANKFDDASLAQQGHDSMIEIVKSSTSKITSDDPAAKLEKEIRLERRIELHHRNLLEIKQELKVRLALRNEATQEARTEAVLSSMEDPVETAKSALEDGKEKSKSGLRSRGRTELEIETEVHNLEARHNLTGIRREKAEDQIKDSAEQLAEAKSLLAGLSNATSSLTAQIALAEQKHEQALDAFNQSKFGEAFGLATASEQLARNARREIERELDREDKDRQPVEERAEVRADVMQNGTEVRVELRFASNAMQKDAIVQEILDKARMSTDKVSSLLRIRNETQQLQTRLRAEARVRGTASEIRFEWRFPLDARDSAGIISGISQKLSSLTAAQVSDVLELKGEGRRGAGNETEIEVEIENGIAKVKVEVGDTRLRFRTPFTTEEALVSEIASRTGMSVDQVKSLMRVKVEDFDDEVRNELEDRRRGRGRGQGEDELRGRGNELGEDIRGNADENEIRGRGNETEVRGRDNEAGEDVRGNADENEVRGRDAEGELPRGADSPSDFDSTPGSRGGGSSGGSTDD